MNNQFFIRSPYQIANTEIVSPTWRTTYDMGRLNTLSNCQEEFGREWEEILEQIEDKRSCLLSHKLKKIEKDYVYHKINCQINEEETVSFLVYACSHSNYELFKKIFYKNYQPGFLDYYPKILRHSLANYDFDQTDEKKSNAFAIIDVLVDHLNLEQLNNLIQKIQLKTEKLSYYKKNNLDHIEARMYFHADYLWSKTLQKEQNILQESLDVLKNKKQIIL